MSLRNWKRAIAGTILTAALVMIASKNRDSSAFPDAVEPLKHQLTDDLAKTFPDPKKSVPKMTLSQTSATDADSELLDEEDDSDTAESDVDSEKDEVQPVQIRNDLPSAAPIPSNVDPYTPYSVQTTLAAMLNEEAAISGSDKTPEEHLALRRERKFNSYLASVASDGGAVVLPANTAVTAGAESATAGNASIGNGSAAEGARGQKNPYTELKEKLAQEQSDQPRHDVSVYLSSVTQLTN